MRRIRRLVPLLLLVLPRLLLTLAAVGVAVCLGGQIGWDSLAAHQYTLVQGVRTHPVEAAALYILVYVVAAALSLPNASALTVAGGLLFGTVLGSALTVLGATIGASVLVLAARSALGNIVTKSGGRFVEQVRDRLRQDGFSYLLALRLLPVVPFWAVNLAAAVCGMKLRTFAPSTFLGIIPASVMLSSIGASFGGILGAGHMPDLSVLFTPRFILPLLGLAVLALLPVLLRRRSGAHA